MLTVIAGLIGILLGGGVRAWEASRARKQDAAALLSAIVAEIEALTRLINHRQVIPTLLAVKEAAEIAIAAGHGHEPMNFIQLRATRNYFAVFEASAGKLGLLTPYQADRIVRFYTFAKAALESLDPDSLLQKEATAVDIAAACDSELLLVHTIVVLGGHIATFRPVEAPSGMVDPFNGPEAIQPALPTPQPDAASQSAGGA